MSDEYPKGATPLGSTLYLFKSKTNSTDCLISAHGGYYKGNAGFEVDSGLEIIFYGEHHKTLSDPGVKLADFDAEPVEVLKGGKLCFNYELSKYQGSHGGTEGKPAETYESINRRVEYNNDRLMSAFNTAITTKNQKVAQNNLKAIMSSRSMSVVTIRNRWFSQNVYLKDVIKAVRKESPSIKRFHCSFCRSLVGDDNAQSAKVKWR
jgi:hypothetical protein